MTAAVAAATLSRRRPLGVVVALVGTAALAAGVTSAGGAVLVLTLVAAVAFGAAALRWPELAALAFVTVLWSNAAVVSTRNYGVPLLVAQLVFLALMIPFLQDLVLGRSPVVVTATLPFVLGYLVALIIATIFSARPVQSFGLVTQFLTEGLLLFFLVSNIVRRVATLRRMMWAVLVASLLMAGITVFQEVTGTYESDYGGFAPVNERGFVIGADADGVEDVRPRAEGPIGEQNRYAQILLIGTACGVGLVLAERGRLRVAAGVATMVGLGGVMLTFSRGALVAVFGLVVVAAAARLAPLRYIALACAVGAGAILAVAPDTVIRLTSLFSATDLDEADGALQGRATSNLASLYVFVDNPVVGVGPGVYFSDYSRQVANGLNLRYLRTPRRAHNLYFEMGADTGVIGLVTFLGAPLVTALALLRIHRRARREDPHRAGLAAGMVLALASYALTSAFLHLSFQRYYWVLLGIAVGGAWCLDDGERPALRRLRGCPDGATAR